VHKFKAVVENMQIILGISFF